MITPLEELSINAWPALQTILDDGWILRLANGYTRRANSINPLYPCRQPVLEKIRRGEELYRSRGLEVIFKMTPAVYPPTLDETLAAEGYRVDAQTSVQTMDLKTSDWPPQNPVSLNENLSDEWFAAFCRMSSVSPQRASTLRQMLNLIAPRHCFASILFQNQVVACGMGVLQSGFIGFYEIVTDPGFRKQGYGQAIMQALMSWGQQAGAHTAYLQVMLNNPPALRLYARLGFKELYQYWYRVKA